MEATGDVGAAGVCDHGDRERAHDLVGGVAGGGVVIDPWARYGRCASCGGWERRDALHGATIRIHPTRRSAEARDEILTVRWCPACHAREVEALRGLVWDRTLVLGAQILANAAWAEEVGVPHDPEAMASAEAARALDTLRRERYRGRAAVMALPEGDDSEAALRARGVALPEPVGSPRGWARVGDEDDGDPE